MYCPAQLPFSVRVPERFTKSQANTSMAVLTLGGFFNTIYIDAGKPIKMATTTATIK